MGAPEEIRNVNEISVRDDDIQGLFTCDLFNSLPNGSVISLANLFPRIDDNHCRRKVQKGALATML